MNRGGGFGGGFGGLVKQAQQMQARIQKVQTEMADKTAEGVAGGGMVKVVANGKQEIVSVSIHRDVVNPNEVDLLQDLVFEATNQALKNASQMMNDAIGSITGGMKLPGMF